MSMNVQVKYEQVYEALEPLRGLKLLGSIQGRPLSKFPLREFVEQMREKWLEPEEYKGHRLLGVHMGGNLYAVCHFGLEEPDDFCVGLEGEDAWRRIKQVADRLSRLTNVSYIEMLSAVVHAIQGLISSEEEEIEEISDPDQIIEELLTWLPEYVQVTD